MPGPAPGYAGALQSEFSAMNINVPNGARQPTSFDTRPNQAGKPGNESNLPVYVGVQLIKLPVERGYKSTWRYAERKPLRLSSEELAREVKKRGPEVLKTHQSLLRNLRNEVDNLLDFENGREPDQKFEWILAAINTKFADQGSVVVILKKQPNPRARSLPTGAKNGPPGVPGAAQGQKPPYPMGPDQKGQGQPNKPPMPPPIGGQQQNQQQKPNMNPQSFLPPRQPPMDGFPGMPNNANIPVPPPQPPPPPPMQPSMPPPLGPPPQRGTGQNPNFDFPIGAPLYPQPTQPRQKPFLDQGFGQQNRSRRQSNPRMGGSSRREERDVHGWLGMDSKRRYSLGHEPDDDDDYEDSSDDSSAILTGSSSRTSDYLHEEFLSKRDRGVVDMLPARSGARAPHSPIYRAHRRTTDPEFHSHSLDGYRDRYDHRRRPRSHHDNEIVRTNYSTGRDLMAVHPRHRTYTDDDISHSSRRDGLHRRGSYTEPRNRRPSEHRPRRHNTHGYYGEYEYGISPTYDGRRFAPPMQRTPEYRDFGLYDTRGR
jgi:hypothetical protein